MTCLPADRLPISRVPLLPRFRCLHGSRCHHGSRRHRCRCRYYRCRPGFPRRRDFRSLHGPRIYHFHYRKATGEGREAVTAAILSGARLHLFSLRLFSLTNCILRAVPIGRSPDLTAVQSFPPKSPQYLGHSDLLRASGECCGRVRWRRESTWKQTFSVRRENRQVVADESSVR